MSRHLRSSVSGKKQAIGQKRKKDRKDLLEGIELSTSDFLKALQDTEAMHWILDSPLESVYSLSFEQIEELQENIAERNAEPAITQIEVAFWSALRFADTDIKKRRPIPVVQFELRADRDDRLTPTQIRELIEFFTPYLATYDSREDLMNHFITVAENQRKYRDSHDE